MIRVFTKENCPNCVKMKEYLKDLEVDFVEDDDLDKLLSWTPDVKSVPQAFIGYERIGDLKALKAFFGDVT